MKREDPFTFLRRSLPPQQYRLIARAEGEDPFEYRPETGRVELTDEWVHRLTSLPEEYLDAFISACELLTEHAELLDLETLRPPPPGGAVHLRFAFKEEGAAAESALRFGPGVAERFQRLLRANTSHSFLELREGKERVVVVKITFLNDWDLFRKKEEVLHLLDLARRQEEGVPYRGTRVRQPPEENRP
ncbi:MAG: hypothetical protein QJR13_09380, partial [Bacillota bacterium]|nr:hypothetical protein [Bacillota bacterium]